MSFGIIYKVTNKINGKVYIGQTTRTLDKRQACHLSEMRACRYNSVFHKALRKYGKDSFIWEIVEHCNTKEELDEMEISYIKQCNSYKFGYNLTSGGGGALGTKHSDEYKIMMSDKQKGKNNSFYNKRHSEDTKRIISEHSLNRAHPKEYRDSIIGEGNPFYGKTHTSVVRDKIKTANRKRVWSEESRAKLSSSLKKRWAQKKMENG